MPSGKSLQKKGRYVPWLLQYTIVAIRQRKISTDWFLRLKWLATVLLLDEYLYRTSSPLCKFFSTPWIVDISSFLFLILLHFFLLQYHKLYSMPEVRYYCPSQTAYNSLSRRVLSLYIFLTKWLFTRCPIQNVLGWFPCVQVTSHVKCIRLVSERSSLPCINIGVRIKLTFFDRFLFLVVWKTYFQEPNNFRADSAQLRHILIEKANPPQGHFHPLIQCNLIRELLISSVSSYDVDFVFISPYQ